MIWTYAIGGGAFCLITIPWKLTTAPVVKPWKHGISKDPLWNYGLSSDFTMSCYHARGNKPLTIHPVRPNSPAYQITSSFRKDHRALDPRRAALLKTCRQTYLEAIDILYTTNTFVLHDIPTLITLSKTIPSQRLNFISNLTFA